MIGLDMQKRFWAILIKKTLLTFVVLFVLGCLFDRFTNEPEYRSPFLAGAVVIACYIAVGLFGKYSMRWSTGYI